MSETLWHRLQMSCHACESCQTNFKQYRLTPIKRRSLALLAASLAFAAGAAHAAYPERPITLIVPWGAGGGTDATARIIGSLLEKELKQPINVVNRTGGWGVVGHQAIASAAPDGYTIGMITVEIGMMHGRA